MPTRTPFSSSLVFVTSSITYFCLFHRRLYQERNREAPCSDSSRKDNVERNNDAGSLSCEKVLALRKKHFSNSVSVSYSNSDPLMIVRGAGSRLVDYNGISYLDTRNNVCHCGHNHPHIIASVQNQIQILNTNTRYLHPNAAILAEKLSNLLPAPLDVVFFVNSGSEANDLALRIARAKTKGTKNTIVHDRAYHGHTLSTLEVSPYKYEYSKEFPDHKPPVYITKVPCPDAYRGQYQGPDAGEQYARHVNDACEKFGGVGNVSAFIMESGMSVAGVILPPPGYLAQAVKCVRDCGGLYIADEVQTGFGRFGTSYWGFQHGSEVVPDIVTVGKPFGNGMPLAAVITSREIANAFDGMGVEYFNTFGGNPVCTAAGLAVLNVVESEGLQKHALDVGSYLMDRLKLLQRKTEIIGSVRGSGLFIGIELVKDRCTMEPATLETSYICTLLKCNYKILTSIDGPNSNVLVLKPPMVFSRKDADEFMSSFERAIMVDLMEADLDSDTISHTPT